MSENTQQKSCLHNFIDPTLHQQLVLASFLDFRSIQSKTHFPSNRNTMASSVRRSFAFLKADTSIHFTQCAHQALGSYQKFVEAFSQFHGPMTVELLNMIPIEAISAPSFDWSSVPELNHLFKFGNVNTDELFQRNSLVDVMAVFSTPGLTLKKLKQDSLESEKHLLALILFLSEVTGFIYENDLRTITVGNALPNFNPFQGVKFDLIPMHLTCTSGPVGYFLAYASEVYRSQEEILKVVNKLKPDWPYR